MKIILTVDSLSLVYGGPSKSVPAMAKGLSQAGADVELWTLRSGFSEVEGVTVRGYTSSREMARSLSSLDRRSTVVHDNGLWLPFNTIVCSALRKAKIPYAISPRGMLDERSMKQSYWKKKIAWALYQYRLLAGATILHATSDLEAQGICKAGFREKVVMVPNGIEGPPDSSCYPKPGNSVLYLARLHPQKGIELLLHAWAAIAPKEWRLKIAGGGEEGYVTSLKQMSTKLAIESQIDWLGPLDDDTKWPAYRDADFFVLPSFSESFGIVVAEALAAGVPVITTTATPWTELEKFGCGVAVEPTESEIVRAVKSFMQLSVAQREAMGLKGRALMHDKYAWPNIANEMLNAYGSALSRANAKSG